VKKCKLCQQEKQLIKKSHILSEFLHSDLFDKNHKLIKFDTADLVKGNNRISKPSSGEYEGGLLCDKCDNQLLGKYETYISNVLKNNLNSNEKINCQRTTNQNGMSFIKVENLDFKKTKLFLLSLLWRAGISSRKDYKEVQLGPYQEKLRKQLYENDSLSDNDIQITILKFEKGTGYSSFIGQPRRHKSGYSTNYSIIINGYLIVYHFRDDKLSKLSKNDRLKENGELNILEIPKNKVNNFVLTYTGIKK